MNTEGEWLCSCWTYLLPLILNQVSAHRLWARERSSLQEQPSTMPLPDSAAALSSPRWQMRQLLSAFVMSASPASRSTSSSEHSDTHDFLPRPRRRRRRTRTGRCSPPRRSLEASARTGHRRPRSTVSPPPRRSPPPLAAAPRHARRRRSPIARLRSPSPPKKQTYEISCSENGKGSLNLLWHVTPTRANWEGSKQELNAESAHQEPKRRRHSSMRPVTRSSAARKIQSC
jgi:hypothetical protein